MTRAYTQPRTFTLSWIVLLLAPVGWATALGVLWSWTDEVCAHGSRDPMWLSAGLAALLALMPAPVTWAWHRRLDGTSAAGERFRFMLGVATGLSLMFTLVLLLSMASIPLLSPCRT